MITNKKTRELGVGAEVSKWIEHMTFMFTGERIEVPYDTAYDMIKQGVFMCAFGDYIVEPSERHKDRLNNTLQAMGLSFRF